jgi:hypothetical protein
MEAVKNMWEELLEEVCSFCSMTTKQRHELAREIPSITNLVEFFIDCRHNGTSVVSQLSGNTSNVGKLCMAYRESDEGDLGNRNYRNREENDSDGSQSH